MSNRLEIMLKYVNKTEIFFQFELPVDKSVLKIAKRLQVLEIDEKMNECCNQESDEKSDKEEFTEEQKIFAPSDVFSKKVKNKFFKSKKIRKLNLDISLNNSIITFYEKSLVCSLF